MLPNLYDDSGLDTFELRLLFHYCRVGNTWEGTRTTARNCNMSIGAVVKKRRSLANKGYIRVNESEHGTLLITVVDKWTENTTKYGGTDDGVHQMNASVSPDEQSRSPGDTKEEPFKKTKEEETPAPKKQGEFLND